MKFIAHRGNNNHGFKENSKDAFISCFDTSYIDGVELDVRLTRDNVVVVSHSNFFNGRLISETDFNNISEINSLDYVLEFLSDKKKIFIDVKGNQVMIDLLGEVIKKYDYDFYICSFNYGFVSLFKKKYLSYKVGLIIGYMINYDKIYNDFDFNVVHYSLIDKVNNKNTFIWTINNRFICNLIKKYGDFDVITDCSYLLK